MNRRERLIASVIGPEMDPEKAAFLDTTIKFILADQGEQYLKFWKLKGPGVMRLIPTQEKDAWCTLDDLREDIRLCESLNNDDLGESLFVLSSPLDSFGDLNLSKRYRVSRIASK